MPRTTDPPVSEAQRRWAFANQNKSSAEGKAAKEFAQSDPGGKLPEKAKDKSMPNDVENPKPASGPMSTKGPFGTSQNLPKTTEPFGAKDNSTGKAMSHQDIKNCYDKHSMDKAR